MHIGRLALTVAVACLAPALLLADNPTVDHFAYAGCGPYPEAHTAWRSGDGFRVEPAITVATAFCKPGEKGYCKWIVYASPFGHCRAAKIDNSLFRHSDFDVRDVSADTPGAIAGPVIHTSVIHVKDPVSGVATHVRRAGPGLFSLTTS